MEVNYRKIYTFIISMPCIKINIEGKTFFSKMNDKHLRVDKTVFFELRGHSTILLFKNQTSQKKARSA